MNNKKANFTPGEKKKLLDAAKRMNSLPRGKWRGQSTYNPGTNVIQIGKLTEKLYFDEAGKFKFWASDTPYDKEDEETEVSGLNEEDCFNWSFLQDGEMLPIGAEITLAWVAGRWYVIDGPCPEDDDREPEGE